MKTTLELPDDLIREVKLRAVHQGRKLKDVMAELLRKGLNAPESARSNPTRIVSDPVSGLPVVRSRKKARLSAETVAHVLLEQEVSWQGDAR